MAIGEHAYMKELYKLTRTVDKLTCGQARIDLNCEEERSFYLQITPDDGYYKGATCKFQVTVPELFPIHAPQVHCLNRIYHPNIDIDHHKSEVCVNLLCDDWEPGVGLDGCVMAVLYLFHHPNREDALNQLFDDYPMNELEFTENVRVSLRGGMVDGFKFDQLVNEINDNNAPMNNQAEENNSQDQICKDANVRIKDTGANENRNDKECIVMNGNCFCRDQVDNGNEKDDTKCKDTNTVIKEAGNIGTRKEDDYITPDSHSFFKDEADQACENVNNQDKICRKINTELKEIIGNRNDNEKTILDNNSFCMGHVEIETWCNTNNDTNAHSISRLVDNANIKGDLTVPDYQGRNEQDIYKINAENVKEKTIYSHVHFWFNLALTVARFYSQVWHKALTIFQRFYNHELR